MAMKTKRVNITTRVAVRTTNPPICGTLKDVEMTTGDILKCLCKRAIVDEILPNGRLARLNMNNYYTDNYHVPSITVEYTDKTEYVDNGFKVLTPFENTAEEETSDIAKEAVNEISDTADIDIIDDSHIEESVNEISDTADIAIVSEEHIEEVCDVQIDEHIETAVNEEENSMEEVVVDKAEDVKPAHTNNNGNKKKKK